MIQLYREVLRTLKRNELLYTELTAALNKDTRTELLTHIRAEFERRRNEKSIEKIKYYLAQGKREFHQLQATLDLTGGK